MNTRIVRALTGSLLWVLAGFVGLLGALLSFTVVLLPVGIPLLFLARRLGRDHVPVARARRAG